MAGSRVFVDEVEPVTLLNTTHLGKKRTCFTPNTSSRPYSKNNKRFTRLYELASSRTLKPRQGLPTGQPKAVRFPF
jgi:hypothetical protein